MGWFADVLVGILAAGTLAFTIIALAQLWRS